ncbi:hypothetical protein [Synechococcus phage MA10]
MATVVSALKPILLAFIASPAVKQLAVDLLRELAKLSDNKLDDAAVVFVETQLLK